VNAKTSERYKAGIKGAFQTYHSDVGLLNHGLYGVVYYFHNTPVQLDADNLSKPIWDALESTAYTDDRAIRLRIAGVFDLRSEPLEVLDLSQMPDYVLEDFLEMIDNEDHILYVEVGRLDYSLFRFGREETSEV